MRQVKESFMSTFHWNAAGEVKWQDQGHRRPGAEQKPGGSTTQGFACSLFYHISETLAETGVPPAFVVTIKNINSPRTQKTNSSFLETLYHSGNTLGVKHR